ncbi:hypothetical protein WCLP8_4110002 [uncultured Gammaproteobacteria bacterium]
MFVSRQAADGHLTRQRFAQLLKQLAAAGIGLGMVPLGTTKKIAPDYIASAITGRDCSIVTLEQTGYYCPPTYEVDRSKLYCYKTLGGIDCHEAPDPYHNGTQALASPPPVRHEQKNGILDVIPPAQ